MSTKTENPDSSTERRETYSYGAQQRHVRSAQDHAGFFLPYLQPGMSLVDCGSGSGSITIDLAEQVAPGQALGIDISQDLVNSARELAESRNSSNVRFEQGSIYAIPCADGSVDAVFIHAVLHHLNDSASALREAMRVLKPGGVIGIREPDWGGRVVGPGGPVGADAEEFFGLWARMIERNGGNPYVGRDVRNLLHESGCHEIVATAAYEAHGTTAGLEPFRRASTKALAPEGMFARQFLEYKLVDQERLEWLRATMMNWFDHPGAFLARTWCEAVGRKP